MEFCEFRYLSALFSHVMLVLFCLTLPETLYKIPQKNEIINNSTSSFTIHDGICLK